MRRDNSGSASRRRTFESVLALALTLTALGLTPASAATVPKVGKSCPRSQIGKVVSGLICTKVKSMAMWRTISPAPTTTVSNPATAPSGTVLFSDDFSNPGSGWTTGSSDGWTFAYRDGSYVIGATAPAAGNRGAENARLPRVENVEIAFDLWLTPGQSNGSLMTSCLDSYDPKTSPADAPLDFVVTELFADGRAGIYVYRGNRLGEKPTLIVDRGFSNADRFDRALLRPGVRFALRCTKIGDVAKIVASLDGTPIIDGSTSVNPGGGLVVLLAGPNKGFVAPAEVRVDNLSVTKA